MPRKIRAVDIAMDLGSEELVDSSDTETCKFDISSLTGVDGVVVIKPDCDPIKPPQEWRRHAISSLLHKWAGGKYSEGPCAGGKSDSCIGGPL